MCVLCCVCFDVVVVLCWSGVEGEVMRGVVRRVLDWNGKGLSTCDLMVLRLLRDSHDSFNPCLANMSHSDIPLVAT